MLTSIDDNGVQQTPQALAAQLLKQHRRIEDDGVDALQATHRGCFSLTHARLEQQACLKTNT